MSDTVIDFGGFTVDVSKITEVHSESVINPNDYKAITFLSDGVGRPVAFGYKTAPAIIAAYEKHRAKVARENLADGWYWATSTGTTRNLVLVKAGRVSWKGFQVGCSTGAPVANTEWHEFEKADPLSPEFLHAIHGNGQHPSVNS